MSELVCYCFRVEKARIVSAIEEGCLSADALGVRLRAGTGCGGCRPDLEDLVRFYGEEARHPASRSPSGGPPPSGSA